MNASRPIRLGLFGLGKAGKEVAIQLMDDPTVTLCWAVRQTDHNTSPLPEHIPVLVANMLDLDDLLSRNPVDFIIDFSCADACLSYAPILAERKIGIVSAVSSYKPRHLACLKVASLRTTVLYSPNITLGINFVIIAARVLRQLAPHAGVEVVEEHFSSKSETSGTAIRIAEILGLDPQKQVNSIRVGGIVGRHEIIFGFPFQTVRLIHDSISRAAFGQGALFAIKALYGRPTGFYTMEQLVSEGFSTALAINEAKSAVRA